MLTGAIQWSATFLLARIPAVADKYIDNKIIILIACKFNAILHYAELNQWKST